MRRVSPGLGDSEELLEAADEVVDELLGLEHGELLDVVLLEATDESRTSCLDGEERFGSLGLGLGGGLQLELEGLQVDLEGGDLDVGGSDHCLGSL